MYDNVVVLNSINHRTLKVRSGMGYDFAKEMNSCILLGQEFLEAAKFYPVVFSVSGETITPVAILGTRKNSFVGPGGRWEAETYMPAFVRRYPYILAEGFSQDGSLTVCIDSDYAGFDNEEGDRLFTDEGENTPVLDGVLEFLKLYHGQYEATKLFIDHIRKLNIFKSVDANMAPAGGETFTYRNFLMIDEEAMHRLPDDEIVKLVRSGYMPWIYANLYSVTNFGRVLTRVENVDKEEA
jgi:hypothetical protein